VEHMLEALVPQVYYLIELLGTHLITVQASVSGPTVYYEIDLFGAHLPITKAVLAVWASALVVFLMVFIPSRRVKLIPGRFQGTIESLLEFSRDQLVHDIMGKEGKPFFPFVATLFLFIFVINLVGLIPGAYAATSETGTTAAFAVIVFLLYNLAGAIKHGPLRYLKNTFVPDVPVLMLVLMIPIELVSHIARPFSLAIRLFANVLAGHMVVSTFATLAVGVVWWLKPLPFTMIVIMDIFEVVVAFLQAYIFAIISAIYIGSAVNADH